MEIIAKKRKWTYTVMILYMICFFVATLALFVMMLIELRNTGDYFGKISGLIVGTGIMFVIFVISTIFFVIKLCTPENMIIFDCIANILIVNLRKRTVILKFSEISDIYCRTHKSSSVLMIYSKLKKKITLSGVANVWSVKKRLLGLIDAENIAMGVIPKGNID